MYNILAQGNYSRQVMGNDSDTTLEITVKKGEPTLVPPVVETRKGFYFLLNLDENTPAIVCTVYYFKSDSKGNEEAVKVIKKALSKVLVHYYPVAGRFTKSSEGKVKVMVDCTGDGAIFVEAEANYEMKDWRHNKA